MMEMGPAVRGLIDAAAVTAIANDATEATLVLKRLSRMPLVELAPPQARDELTSLITGLRRRTETAFLTWAVRHDIPTAELRYGLETYERCVAAEMAGVLHDLTPADTPRATLEKAVKEAASRAGILEGDIVARDIGWELVKAALNAAQAYAEPLRTLLPKLR